MNVRSGWLKTLATHPYTSLIGRMVLGGVFVYASWYKLVSPEEFARSILNYRILPPVTVNLFAIILPWLELICGLLLLVGLFTGGSSLLVAGMLTVFLVALSAALIRGIDISCGCFSSKGATPLTWGLLVRDGILLALAVQIACCRRAVLSLDNLRSRRRSDLPQQ
jgi:putative oxidoreductase